ncbi:MAG: hypothetical protein GY772_26310, partial [bacterium]|nr:hypothetical protein [bacterium]
GDAATPETPYVRGRVGIACLHYGGLRASPAYNNMMRASLEDSPALLLGAQELHESQEMAMQQAGWASSGIYRGLCVLARRPVATEVQVVHDYGMVDVPNEVSRLRIAVAVVHASQRVQGESRVALCTFHLHNVHAKKRDRFLGFIQMLAEGIQQKKCRILCGDANMRAYDMVPALAGRGIQAVMAARHCEFQRDTFQRCLDDILLHASLRPHRRPPPATPPKAHPYPCIRCSLPSKVGV